MILTPHWFNGDYFTVCFLLNPTQCNASRGAQGIRLNCLSLAQACLQRMACYNIVSPHATLTTNGCAIVAPQLFWENSFLLSHNRYIVVQECDSVMKVRMACIVKKCCYLLLCNILFIPCIGKCTNLKKKAIKIIFWGERAWVLIIIFILHHLAVLAKMLFGLSVDGTSIFFYNVMHHLHYWGISTEAGEKFH